MLNCFSLFGAACMGERRDAPPRGGASIAADDDDDGAGTGGGDVADGNAVTNKRPRKESTAASVAVALSTSPDTCDAMKALESMFAAVSQEVGKVMSRSVAAVNTAQRDAERLGQYQEKLGLILKQWQYERVVFREQTATLARVSSRNAELEQQVRELMASRATPVGSRIVGAAHAPSPAATLPLVANDELLTMAEGMLADKSLLEPPGAGR